MAQQGACLHWLKIAAVDNGGSEECAAQFVVLTSVCYEQVDVKDFTFEDIPLLLTESCVPAQVVAAIDVNNVANAVYKRNFPHTQLLAKTIEVSNYYYCLHKYKRGKCD